MRFPAILVLGLTASCGYSAGGLYDHRAVRVTIFDNVDERRGHEFDLTQAVHRELQGAGIRVNSPDASVELTGKILGLATPAAVEGKTDEVIVGSVVLRVEVVLSDRASGRELRRAEQSIGVNFSSARAESTETARQEAFDRIARWVLTLLEREW